MVNTIEIDNPEYILATSGESFHWARRFLGNKMGHDAARLYSFCRVLDDMADGDIENGPEHLSIIQSKLCLLYTSPSPRDIVGSRMPSSA